MSEQPEQAALRLYARWLGELWGGDLAVARELVTPDFAVHHGAIHPGGDRELTGPEGIADLVAMGRSCFRELAFTPRVGPVVQGDLLCARWEGRGTYAGGFPGATAAPGTRVAFCGNDILRMADGRFTAYWVCSDGPYLAAQLGTA